MCVLFYIHFKHFKTFRNGVNLVIYLLILGHLREEKESLWPCFVVPKDSVVQTKADAKWQDDGLE